MIAKNRSVFKKIIYDLFIETAEYQRFIDLLKETAVLFNANVAAFFLIPTR